MNRSADQALRSLLPTHNGPLPPQLADLAGSLLAQSRHRASTLKADEEIARPYVCAHIACDRLKTALNLPPMEPRPPIQPRLYKRLYAYMNTVLGPAASANNSNNNNNNNNNRVEGSLASPANKSTPVRRQANAPLKTQSTPSRTPGAQTPRRLPLPLPPPPKPATGTFPPWLRPTVRFVCHDLGYALLAPTIMAGLTVIHQEVADEAKEKARQKKSGGGNDNDDDDDDDEDMPAWLEDNLTPLVAALYLYCMTAWRGVLRQRAQTAASGAAAAQDAGLEERQFQLDEKAILGVFEKVRSVVGKGGTGNTTTNLGDEAWAGWQDLQRRTFRDALVVVSEQQWLQSDWYQDIDTLGSSGGVGDDEKDNVDDDDGDGAGSDSDGEADKKDIAISSQLWRADGMLQARYDFLDPGKRSEYEKWKLGVIERIKSAPQAMEVDS